MENYDSTAYKTTDLALAAALVACNFPVKTINRSAGKGRAVFIFTRDKRLASAVSDYWEDKLNVSPKTYFDAMKHLKTRIYAEDYGDT